MVLVEVGLEMLAEGVLEGLNLALHRFDGSLDLAVHLRVARWASFRTHARTRLSSLPPPSHVARTIPHHPSVSTSHGP